jgi:hypothetical protein
MIGRLFWRFLGLLWCISSPALLAETKGPSLTWQSRGPATYEKKAGAAADVDLDLTSREWLEAHLLYPVIDGSYQLVPLLDFQHLYFHKAVTPTPPGFKPSAALGVGVAQVWDMGSDVGSYLQSGFLITRQFNAPDFKGAPPMREVILGLNLAARSADAGPDLRNEDPRVTLGFRVRWYPYVNRYLPIFGIKSVPTNGFFYDALYPSHLHLGWNLLPYRWRIVTGLEILSVNFPFQDSDFSGWQEGYGAALVGAVRIPLADPLHMQVKAGMLQEFISAFTEDGYKLGVWESQGAPFVEIALQSVFP